MNGVATAMARVSGEGLSAQIQVSGRGTVVLRGRLALSGNLTGRAAVSIQDRARDAVVHVDGDTIPLGRRGRATLRVPHGILYVTGSDVTVRVTGRGLSISAAGSGTARLTGSGRYRLNLGAERSWPRVTIKLTTTPARPTPASRSPKRR